MNIHEINPYIRRAQYSVMQRPNLSMRSIYDYELLYIAGGKFLLTYDGEEYLCAEGDILLLHPGVEHSFTDIGVPLDQPHIHFDLEYSPVSETTPVSFESRTVMSAANLRLIQPDRLSGQHVSPFLCIANREAFFSAFFGVIDRYTANGKRTDLNVKANMLTLISTIITDNFPECMQKEQKNQSMEMQTVKNFIDANCHTGLTMKIIEQHFYFSRSYMEKQFKQAYGISIMRYCAERRMARATELLKTESVTRVSEALSFSSINAFSRAFKTACGISPADFKRRMREK